jgi:hypothetical protein
VRERGRGIEIKKGEEGGGERREDIMKFC